MFDKIPQDRRWVVLGLAALVGVGGGWYISRQSDLATTLVTGALVAFGVTLIILNAAQGGDMNGLLNAVRGASDGVRPARPAGVSPAEGSVYDALDSLAQKVSGLDARSVSGERTADERKSE